MRFFLRTALLILILSLIALSMVACSDEGEGSESANTTTEGEKAPTIEINSDGFWVINGIVTEVKASGSDGAKGDTGETGAKGDKGDTGEPGAKGDQGDPGETGAKGDQGDPGEPGAKGDQGDTGVGIKSVALNDAGKLVITLTDGTVLPAIDLPGGAAHKHTVNTWLPFSSQDTESCEDRLYYAACNDCAEITWRQGNADDHIIEADYSSNSNDHWYECENCYMHLERSAHEYDNNCDAECNVCKAKRSISHPDENADGICDECLFDFAHEHVYEWFYDEESHWLRAICGHELDDIEVGAHVDSDEDIICDKCSWDYDHQHSYVGEWSFDETHHWREATCEHENVKVWYSGHTDIDGNLKCDTCGSFYEDLADPDEDEGDIIVTPPHYIGGKG